MSMRLLPKSEIAQAKADATRQQIDQGRKIAKRVDDVRETLAQEEVNLEKFRSETVKKIHLEIKEASLERDSILKDVDEARNERTKLLAPLDNEWATLVEAKKQFSLDVEEANQRTLAARKLEREANQALKQASDALARQATRDEVSREKLKETVEANKTAVLALRNAEAVEQKALQLKENLEAELIHRDMEMAARERGVTMKEATLHERESDLARGWKLLNDRIATFERRITRTKQ